MTQISSWSPSKKCGRLKNIVDSAFLRVFIIGPHKHECLGDEDDPLTLPSEILIQNVCNFSLFRIV